MSKQPAPMPDDSPPMAAPRRVEAQQPQMQARGQMVYPQAPPPQYVVYAPQGPPPPGYVYAQAPGPMVMLPPAPQAQQYYSQQQVAPAPAPRRAPQEDIVEQRPGDRPAPPSPRMSGSTPMHGPSVPPMQPQYYQAHAPAQVVYAAGPAPPGYGYMGPAAAGPAAQQPPVYYAAPAQPQVVYVQQQQQQQQQQPVARDPLGGGPVACVKCRAGYNLPYGATSWRCKNCRHFNTTVDECCRIL